jgi:hypothetical protein
LPNPIPNYDEHKFKSNSEMPNKKRDLTKFCRIDTGEKQIDQSVNIYEDIYDRDIELTVKDIRNISCAIRRASVVMPELLRIIRERGFHEELVGAIDELAYAIHDTTVTIRSLTRGLSNQ